MSSPQTVHLRSLSLDCSPGCAKVLVSTLETSLHFKNLQQLSLKHCDLGNEELILMNRAKCLGGLRALDLGWNKRINMQELADREDLEEEGICNGVGRFLVGDSD